MSLQTFETFIYADNTMIIKFFLQLSITEVQITTRTLTLMNELLQVTNKLSLNAKTLFKETCGEEIVSDVSAFWVIYEKNT